MSQPPVGCPYSGKPGVYGESDLTYNDYLKIGELLKLQVPQSEPAHHDELLFIIIHQAYELWFKLILHEIENSIRQMQDGNVLRAHHFVKRTVEIMKVLVSQIHILETMTPAEFLQFRDRLMPASGFQSMQYREIEFLAGLKDEAYLEHFKNRPEFLEILKKRLKQPDLKSAYYDLLHSLSQQLGKEMPKNAAEIESKILNGTETRVDEINKVKHEIMSAILPIYQHQESHLPLYLLSESLVDFDQYFSLWREHHVRVVERIIGFKHGSGGSSGVGYLRSTTVKKMFPYLWEVRTYLEKD
jgi:tryptophan 2,3-dioxygenase